MDFPTDENLLVGLDRADDAGVYRISDDLALIQTIDFFTPVVDDPYWFGQIAAANALSDVYAMGGEPKTAMNLVAFPIQQMDIAVLRAIIQGGIDKMRQAGVVLVGGHSIEDKELKYGLSVTGFVHPQRVLTKKNLHAGDQLILTKALGTGILNTAIKAGLASQDVIDHVTRLMAALNRNAARVMAGFAVHACTDITGFGLLGHLAEMVLGSGLGIRVYTDKVPVIPGTIAFADMGLVPGGGHRNREFRQPMVQTAPGISRAMIDVLFDPQTSGGLLIAVAAHEAPDLVDGLLQQGVETAAIVGEVIAGAGERLFVK
jgi:selenide,water dikinase